MSTPTVDYTKMRKGSRPDGRRKIEVCPKCGRKGLISRYKDGKGMTTHKGHKEFIFFMVDDSCFLSPELLKEHDSCNES